MSDAPQPAPAVEDELDLLDLLQVVTDNLRLLVVGPLLAGLVALGITFILAPTYTATTRIMPPLQQQSCGVAIGKDYPAPVVDHAVQREKALALYQAVKAE